MENMQSEIDYFNNKKHEIFKMHNIEDYEIKNERVRSQYRKIMCSAVVVAIIAIAISSVKALSLYALNLPHSSIIMFMLSVYVFLVFFNIVCSAITLTITKKNKSYCMSIIGNYYLNNEEMLMVKNILASYTSIQDEEKEQIVERHTSNEGISLNALFLILQEMDFSNEEVKKQEKRENITKIILR